jgi:hypothetical protein
LRAHTLFVDDAAFRETSEPVSGGVRVRLAGGDEMGEAPAGGGRGLEAAIAPAGIEIETFDGREAASGQGRSGIS